MIVLGLRSLKRLLPVGSRRRGSADEGSGPGKRINTTGVSRSSRPELRDTAKKEATSMETEWMMKRRKTGRHDIGEGSHKPARLEQDKQDLCRIHSTRITCALERQGGARPERSGEERFFVC